MYKAHLGSVIPGGEGSGVDTWPVRSILTSCYWKKRHLRIYSTIRSGFPSFRVIIIICYYWIPTRQASLNSYLEMNLSEDSPLSDACLFSWYDPVVLICGVLISVCLADKILFPCCHHQSFNGALTGPDGRQESRLQLISGFSAVVFVL